MVLALAPLLHADLSRGQSPYMLCSDASMLGGAALYTDHVDWHRTQTCIYTNKQEAVEYTNPLPSLTWKQITQVRWAYKKHINVLEGVAVLLGLRWMGRNSHLRGCQVTVIIDSQVIFYMLKKGRTGSERLYRTSRRIGALSLALNLRIDPVWVPSKENPSDAPSRA